MFRVVLIFFCSVASFNALSFSHFCNIAFNNSGWLEQQEKGFPFLVAPERAFEVTVPGVEKKFLLHFKRPNSWGAGPEVELGLEVSTTVKNIDEASLLIKALAANGPREWQQAVLVEPGNGKNIFSIGNFLEGHISESGINKDGSGILKLYIPQGQSSALGARNLVQGLTQLNLKKVKDPETRIDITTKAGKMEWGQHSFREWKKGLSIEEVRALRDAGEAPYREIHSYLRDPNPGKQHNPRIQETVKNLDTAISRGEINREVTVYRADSNPKLLELWRRLSNKSEQAIDRKIQDKAYTFTSLDRDVAEWWMTAQLKNPSVLLEIQVPAGAKAAFIDAEGIQSNRGYLELMFPREAVFNATEATTDKDGRMVLKVKLEQ